MSREAEEVHDAPESDKLPDPSLPLDVAADPHPHQGAAGAQQQITAGSAETLPQTAAPSPADGVSGLCLTDILLRRSDSFLLTYLPPYPFLFSPAIDPLSSFASRFTGARLTGAWAQNGPFCPVTQRLASWRRPPQRPTTPMAPPHHGSTMSLTPSRSAMPRAPPHCPSSWNVGSTVRRVGVRFLHSELALQ